MANKFIRAEEVAQSLIDSARSAVNENCQDLSDADKEDMVLALLGEFVVPLFYGPMPMGK